eukprot:GEMP01029805.1.p1 GENE.GEMP01029805.1~~GEMP01029805.1.p1  ORF type:complete len:580 (+),score=125.59 GEMP01029805.1:28-1740(+)
MSAAIDRLTELRDGYRQLLASVQHLKTENTGLETPGPGHTAARPATPERYGTNNVGVTPRSEGVLRHLVATRAMTKRPVDGPLSDPQTPIRQVVNPAQLGPHAAMARPSPQHRQPPVAMPSSYDPYVRPSAQQPAPRLNRTSTPALLPSYSGAITPPPHTGLYDRATPSAIPRTGQLPVEPRSTATAPFMQQYPVHQPQPFPTSRPSMEGYYPHGQILPQQIDGGPSPGVPSLPSNASIPQHANGVIPSTLDFIGPFLGAPPTVGSFQYAPAILAPPSVHTNVLFPVASARHASPLPFATARAASPLPFATARAASPMPAFQRGSSVSGLQRRPSAPPRLFTNPLIAPPLASVPMQHGRWDGTSALLRGVAPAAPCPANKMQWLGGGSFPIRVPRIGVQPMALMSLTEDATRTTEFKHQMTLLGLEKMERVVRARLLDQAGAFFDRMLMHSDSQPLSRISRGLDKLGKIGRALDGDILRSVNFSRFTDTVCRGPDIQLAASMELYNLSSLIRYAISMQLSWAFIRLQVQGISLKKRATVPVDRRNFASQVQNAPNQVGEATSTFAMLKKV